MSPLGYAQTVWMNPEPCPYSGAMSPEQARTVPTVDAPALEGATDRLPLTPPQNGADSASGHDTLPGCPNGPNNEARHGLRAVPRRGWNEASRPGRRDSGRDAFDV